MKRTAIVLVVCISWAGLATAQQPSGIPITNAIPSPPEPKPFKTAETAPVSPSETPLPPEVRAHEDYLLRLQAAEESVIRAAKARADQRTRRLESRRWFGISNQRPAVSTDPYNSDYAPHWIGNDPGMPNRWVGAGQPWMSASGE